LKAEDLSMRIVVGLDGSESSLTAHKLISSTSWPAHTQFLFAHARESSTSWAAMFPGGGWFADGDARAQSREALRALDALAEPLRKLGHLVEVQYEEGPAALTLRDAAAEYGADLIVVGSRGRGPAVSAILGSVSADLVDHAPCPVLVARQPAVTRILLATDGSENAHRIPDILGRWHAFRGIPFEVVSVAPSPMHSAELMVTPWATPAIDLSDGRMAREAAARQWRFAEDMVDQLVDGGWSATASVRFGDAADQIIAAAQDAGCDLIISGSRGLGDLRRLLTGSVAHDVLLRTHASMLVMRGRVPARVEKGALLAVRNAATA
jgi:nucleotide-binding universal stress UspA family protein